MVVVVAVVVVVVVVVKLVVVVVVLLLFFVAVLVVVVVAVVVVAAVVVVVIVVLLVVIVVVVVVVVVVGDRGAKSPYLVVKRVEGSVSLRLGALHYTHGSFYIPGSFQTYSLTFCGIPYQHLFNKGDNLILISETW